MLLAGTCFSVPLLQNRAGPAAADGRPRVAGAAGRRNTCSGVAGAWTDRKPLGKPEIVLIGASWPCWRRARLRRLAGEQLSAGRLADRLLPDAGAVYWIARQTKFSERAALALFGCFALFGVYLAVTSLAEYFKPWWLVFPTYIATTAAEPDAEFVGRGRGPLLNPIANGILLSICFGSALLWWPRLRRPGQCCCVVVMLLFLAAISCSADPQRVDGRDWSLALAVGLALPWSWRLPLLGGGVAGRRAGDRYAMGQPAQLQARRGPGRRQNGRIGRAAADPGHDRLAHVPRPAAVGLRLLPVQDRAPRTTCPTARPICRWSTAGATFRTTSPFSLLTETGLVGLGLFAAMRDSSGPATPGGCGATSRLPLGRGN